MPQLSVEQAFALAIEHHRAGRLPQAEQIYRQILAQHADHAGALQQLGHIAYQTRHYSDAAEFFQKAAALLPGDALIHTNLAGALCDAGKLEAAVAACKRAIAIDPRLAEAHYNLGNILQKLSRQGDAIAAYQRAIALQPDYAKAHYNLANRFRETDNPDAAIAAYRRAIDLLPNHVKARINLGRALMMTGNLDQAIEEYRQAMIVSPRLVSCHSCLVYAMLFHPGYDGPAIARENRSWAQKHADAFRAGMLPHANSRQADRPLRVGYVSPDFRGHVVGQNLLPLVRAHDRAQFQVFCYSDVVAADEFTREFQSLAHCWRNINGVPDEQVASLIRQDGIDILVDLTLHMANNRLLVFARKPAPVQVTYLAYAGSSGMSAMDWRLSDPYLDPVHADLSIYSEKTYRLPRTYWCYQPRTQDSPAPSPLLSAGHVTFGCLNNFAKVSRPAIDLWGQILARVENSHLILHASPGKHREALLRSFATAGVGRERIEFVGNQSFEHYVPTYGRIDIALDPFPWGGGITTLDALWLGVPVVTLSGQTAVGRGGRSILSNLNLPELIAFDADQYTKIAVDLAQDRDRLAQLRSTLRDRLRASPLMDAAGFARDVEQAYRLMWREWCRG
jgi:predicted O-linked N-acetylglucosamine transferase (SPINDLY family)